MPSRKKAKSKKKPGFPCGKCKTRRTCQGACKKLNLYLKGVTTYRREVPVSFIPSGKQNTVLDLLDLGRSHPVEDRRGKQRYKAPFTLAELQQVFDFEYNFPFLRKVENDCLSLRWGQGKSPEQIAFALKISARQARAILERAQKKLRKAIDEDHPFLERRRKEREAMAIKMEKEIKGFSREDIQRYMRDYIQELKNKMGGRRKPKAAAWADKPGQEVAGESVTLKNRLTDKIKG